MIVDSSVLVAMLLRETGHEGFEQTIRTAPIKRVSALAVVETVCLMMRSLPHRPRAEVTARVVTFVDRLGIVIEPVDREAAASAATVYAEQGRGAGRADLNFGDVFVAALALERGEPILAAGTDEFLRTGLPQVA